MANSASRYGQPGNYNVTPSTRNDGDTSGFEFDQVGNLKVTLQTLIAGEDLTNNRLRTEYYGTPAVISTATTTVIKTGAGHLHTITVTGGTAGTIIVYDNTAASGTKLADYDSTNAIATYILDVVFSTGLTIITSAATKLTVSYR